MPTPKLKTRKVNGVPFTESSGNLWRDLAYPDAEERQAKSALALAIRHRVEALGFTQAETAKRLGVTQPRVSEIFNLRVQGYTLDKLSTLLLRLGATVRVTVDFDDERGGLHVDAA